MQEELHIKLTPRSSFARVIEEGEEGTIQFLKVYVTAVPEDGKANDAMIKLLADYFKMPKSVFKLLRGHKSRNKVVQICSGKNK